MFKNNLLHLPVLFLLFFVGISCAGSPLPSWTWCQTSCGNPAPGGGGSPKRDPALWPFANTSPWNYPIGSNAAYAAITKSNGTAFTSAFVQSTQFNEGVWIAQTSDPVTNISHTDRDSAGGPTFVYATNIFPRHIPSGITLPVGEFIMIVVTPDHLTAMELYTPTFSGGVWSTGAANDNVDLKGPGWGPGSWGGTSCSTTGGIMAILYSTGDSSSPMHQCGYAYGQSTDSDGQAAAAGFASLGGLIRSGELANGIPHALAVVLDAPYLNNNTPGNLNYVWPATSRDAPASVYGTTGNIYMGSLLAIPLSVNVNTLGLQTPQALNIAKALQNYGGYIRDTGGVIGDIGVNTFTVWMDYNARTELPTSAAFTSDMNLIATNVQVITNGFNNLTGGAPQGGTKLDGGDGTLSAPLAPQFDR